MSRNGRIWENTARDLSDPSKGDPASIWKVADTLNSLGSVYQALGEYSKAIDYYEQSLAIRQRIFGPKHPSVAEVLNNLGCVYTTLGDYLKAI